MPQRRLGTDGWWQRGSWYTVVARPGAGGAAGRRSSSWPAARGGGASWLQPAATRGGRARPASRRSRARAAARAPGPASAAPAPAGRRPARRLAAAPLAMTPATPKTLYNLTNNS